MDIRTRRRHIKALQLFEHLVSGHKSALRGHNYQTIVTNAQIAVCALGLDAVQKEALREGREEGREEGENFVYQKWIESARKANKIYEERKKVLFGIEKSLPKADAI